MLPDNVTFILSGLVMNYIWVVGYFSEVVSTRESKKLTPSDYWWCGFIGLLMWIGEKCFQWQHNRKG